LSHAILIGDCREQMRTLPEKSVQCVVTSPPYFGLRNYGVEGQLGLEPTPAEFVAAMVEVFAEVWRVLRDDGVCFVNLGDSYSTSFFTRQGKPRNVAQGRVNYDQVGEQYEGKEWGAARYAEDDFAFQPGDLGSLKPKDLMGMPWRVAFALQEAGWYLRQDIIWAKPNPMPESVRDRCCKAHEYIFVLTKSERYFWDGLAIATPGKGHIAGNKNHKYADAYATGEGGETHRTKAGLKEMAGQQAATSNRRSVWTISTQSYKGAHFATFPERIPELCIKAATSEKGCCSTCGKCWRRVTEKVRRPSRPGNNSKVYADPEGSPYEQHSGTIVGNRDPQRHVTETVTTGWEPSCKCDAAEPVPCTVLDPFLGSGTTVQVATWLGRHGIGCELNETYAGLSEARIKTPPRFMTRKTTKGKKRRRSKSQGVLFSE